MYWPDHEQYIIICTTLLHIQEWNLIAGWEKQTESCLTGDVLLRDPIFSTRRLRRLKMPFREALRFHCARIVCRSWMKLCWLSRVLLLKRQWAALSRCLSRVNTNLDALSARCGGEKKGKRNASRPDALPSNTVVEIMVFWGPLRFSLEERFIHHRTGWGAGGGVGWVRRGFMRQPDILRNGNVRYLTEVFRAGSPGFIEFCGLCRGILRPWSDSIQTFSWCSLRWSVWHFDTASIGFVAFQPLACQSIWGEMPESEFSISNNDW